MKSILAKGKYLHLINRDGWEYAHRPNTNGVVLIGALTPDNKLLLVEQYRVPVSSTVIELPAGLSGDIPGQENEELIRAAERELVEETGYAAADLQLMLSGPISAGLCDETVNLFIARNLTRVGPGGGDDSENIRVHEVPFDHIEDWLREQAAQGRLLDPKIYTAIYFLRQTH